MENTSLIGLSRQITLQRELDVIANNVANVTTNGFKRRSGLFSEHVMPVARADAPNRADRSLSFVIDRGTALDLSTGATERTGNPLDVAIRSDAFFVVQTPNGERFTRNGALSLSSTGDLVTSDGHPILTEQGPASFTAADHDIRIAQDGTVSTAQGNKGRLRQVTFANSQSLENIGGNLFASSAAPRPAGPQAMLETGAVERSNVSPVTEIARMIDVNRSYSALAQMLQRNDELRRSAISRLAEAA